jgi:hypothetical protein
LRVKKNDCRILLESFHCIILNSASEVVIFEKWIQDIFLGCEHSTGAAIDTIASRVSSFRLDAFPPLMSWMHTDFMSAPAAVYRTRNPQSSKYCKCVEDYFEDFVRIYEEWFELPFLAPLSIRSFTEDNGDTHNGSALKVKLL